MSGLIGMFIEGIPVSVQIITEILLILIGAVECFAGFKTRKAMIAVWGFFLGAAIGVAVGIAFGSSAVSVCASLILGVGVAVLAYKFYLAGVFLLTGTLTYLAALLLSQSYIIAIAPAVAAGVLSVLFVRPVIIVSTSISGAAVLSVAAWMMIGMNPDNFHIPMVLIYVLMIIVAAAGVMCQFLTTSPSKRKVVGTPVKASKTLTFSERRYPGMQHAYRNFCIKCGNEIADQGTKCPKCGFEITD